MIWSTFLFDSLIILFGEMIHSVPSYVKNFCGLCGSKHIGDGVIKQLDVHVSTSKKVSDSEKRKSSRLLPGGPLLLVSLIIAQNYRHFQVPIAGKFWPFFCPKTGPKAAPLLLQLLREGIHRSELINRAILYLTHSS